jgi:hypothetical protein
MVMSYSKDIQQGYRRKVIREKRAFHHPEVSFSDPVDELSSDVESFNEDDMYGSDHCMEVVSESTDNEEEVDVPQLSEDRAVSTR